MVFAANGGTVIDGVVYGARFRDPERQQEAAAYPSWFQQTGSPRAAPASQVHEGEGDFAVRPAARCWPATASAATQAAAAEVTSAVRPAGDQPAADRPAVYHLDTALAVLGGDNVAYRGGVRRGGPEGSPTAVPRSDRGVRGRRCGARPQLGLRRAHVVVPVQAAGLSRSWTPRGYQPVPVDMSELLKAGGGPKCCTLELRREEVGVPEDMNQDDRTGGARDRRPSWTRPQLPPPASRHQRCRRRLAGRCDGRRYLDCLAGYSALNFGHRHPSLVDAARKQLERVTLTSRAFLHDQLGAVLRRAGRAVRHGDGAADEYRCRGGGNRDQGRAQVGLRRSRACPTARPKSSWSTATSTAGPPRSSASPPTRTP